MTEGGRRNGRVLIIGGMGFVGLHTASKLVDVGHEVVITQHSQRREPEFLKDVSPDCGVRASGGPRRGRHAGG